jgi:hypothetical protein
MTEFTPTRWKNRRARGAVLVTACLWIAGGITAAACPICFRVEQGPVTDGVQAAVLVLMGVTTGVLSGFGIFIAGFIRRTREARTSQGAPRP